MRPRNPQGLVALNELWKKTKGTLSLDISRQRFKGGAPGDSLWRVSRHEAPTAPGQRRRHAPHSRRLLCVGTVFPNSLRSPPSHWNEWICSIAAS